VQGEQFKSQQVVSISDARRNTCFLNPPSRNQVIDGPSAILVPCMSNLEPPISRSGTGILQGAVDFLHIHHNWPFVTRVDNFVICGLVGSGAAQRGKPRASNFLASLDVDDIIWSLLDESDQLPRP
jgi:hypothetical protein